MAVSSLSFSNKDNSKNSFRTKILGRDAAGHKFTLRDYAWTNHDRLEHMNGMKISNEQKYLFGTTKDIYSAIPTIYVDEFDASQFNTDELYIAAKAIANKLTADGAKDSMGKVPGETSGGLEAGGDAVSNAAAAAGAVTSGNAIESAVELGRDFANKTSDSAIESMKHYMEVIAGRNDADALKRIAFGNQYEFPIGVLTNSLFNGRDAGFGDAATYGSKTGLGNMLSDKLTGGMTALATLFSENNAQRIDLENMSLNESLMAIPASPKWQGTGDGKETIAFSLPIFNRTATDYVNNMKLILALGMGSMSAVQSLAGFGKLAFAEKLTSAATAVATPACIYDVHIPGLGKKYNCNINVEVKPSGMLRTVNLSELPGNSPIKQFFASSHAKTFNVIVPDMFIIDITFNTVFNHNVNALVDYYYGKK